LINEILNLSRIESGKQEIHVGDIDVKELVNSSIATVEPLIRSDKVRIWNDSDDSYPKLVSDEVKLRQILINLLSNAVKFTLEGSIIVSVTSAKGRVQFAVSDSGIGIEEKNLTKVFEEFFMGTQVSGQKGTGLGLTISKQLAKLLGGDIYVKSTVGVGTTFTVDLPLHLAPQSLEEN
jgi:signal transduction histidine kinase